MACSIRKSDWVRVHGLTSEKGQQLNGKVGEVQDSVRSDGRIPVRVCDSLHLDSYEILIPNPILGPTPCTRHFLKEKEGLLIKVDNLLKVPDEDMTILVRVACLGEARAGMQPLLKEIRLPSMHPIFYQEQNCPIPAHLGLPLILTKIDFAQRQNIKGKIWERSFMQNQPCTYLRVNVRSGFVPSTALRRLDDEDFIGPCYVCQLGGHKHWTIEDAENMQAYLSYLLQDCYGRRDFDAEKEIGAPHFQVFLKSKECNELRLLQAAKSGDVKKFWECFVDINHVTDNLVEAAVESLSGEIMGALVTRSASSLDVGKVINLIKERAESCGETQASEKAMWFGAILHMYNAGKDALKRDSDLFPLVQKADAMYIPKTLNEYGPLQSLAMLGITDDMIRAMPFPEEEMRVWLSSSEFSAMRDKYISKLPNGETAGYFDGLVCDISLVKKLYSLALEIHRDQFGKRALEHRNETLMRAEIRNIGWTLFFRGSIDAMRIHHEVFMKALVLSPLNDKEFYFRDHDLCSRAIFECHGLVECSWDCVGTWVN